MIFQQICTSTKRKNVAYIVGDDVTREVAIIDAGFKPELILQHVERLDASVKLILATHGHRDHIAAAPSLAEATGAPIAAYKTVPDIDIALDDSDVLHVGRVRIGILHTPGHSADSVCFMVDGKKLFTGDTLYVGTVPKPGPKLARVYFASLHDRILRLGDDVEIWPGHAGRRRSSTIGHERRNNHVLQMTYREFAYTRRLDRELGRWIIP